MKYFETLVGKDTSAVYVKPEWLIAVEPQKSFSANGDWLVLFLHGGGKIIIMDTEDNRRKIFEQRP